MNEIQKALIGHRLSVERSIRGHHNYSALDSDNVDFEKGVYVDNAFNRMLKRVGQRYGRDVDLELQEYRNETTADLHRISKGVWTEERTAIQNDIVDKFFEGKTPVPKGEKKICTLLLGGGGSGKTYIYKNFFEEKVNTVSVNSDDIKAALPEWNEFHKKDWISKAYKMHRESSDVSHTVLDKAVNEGYNFTLDGTLSNTEYARELIAKVKALGYEVKVVGVMCDIKIAQYSALKRGYLGKDQRMVAAKIVREANIGARKTLKAIFQEGLADDVSVYDNSGQNRYIPPKIIVKNNKINDVNQLKSFLQRTS